MVGGKTVSVLGDSVLAIVLLLRVHDAGEGFLGVAALMACEALPVVALMGVAGRIADSRDSRSVLLASTGAQALACLALLAVHQLAMVLGLVLVIQTAQAISQATWSGLTPRVAGEAHLGRVISLQQGMVAIASPIGAAIGPMLFGLWGATAAILLDASTFGLLALAVLTIRTRRHVHPTAAQPHGIRLDLLRRDPQLWLLLLGLTPVVLVLVAVNVLDVFLVRDELGVAAAWYGLSSAAWGLGALVGALIAGILTSNDRRITVAVTSLVAIGLLCLATGLAPNFAIYLACSAGVGVANGASNACFGTVLMSRTPDEDRGKVSATVNGLVQGASVVGLPLGGVIGGLIGTRPAIVASGAVTCTLVAAVAIRMKRLEPLAPEPVGSSS